MTRFAETELEVLHLGHGNSAAKGIDACAATRGGPDSSGAFAGHRVHLLVDPLEREKVRRTSVRQDLMSVV